MSGHDTLVGGHAASNPTAGVFDPHDVAGFVEVPQFEVMAQLSLEDPARFRTTFSPGDRVALGHYLQRKQRHADWKAKQD